MTSTRVLIRPSLDQGGSPVKDMSDGTRGPLAYRTCSRTANAAFLKHAASVTAERKTTRGPIAGCEVLGTGWLTSSGLACTDE